MQTRSRHLRMWIAMAFAAAAVGAPTAQAVGVSPDDRPFYRGGSEALAPTSLSPDDRPFARPFDTEPAVHVEVVRSSGFDWVDGAIGGALGAALALLGAGAILTAQHRRGTLGTA